MDYLYQRNRFVARELGPAAAGAPPPDGDAITAAGQARDRDRRRRHGRRLRRELAPRGRGVGHADRARRRAAALAPGRGHAVAALADEAAHPVRAEGGRRARLRDLDHAVPRQRPRRSEIHWAQNSGRPPFELVAGTEETHARPTSSCSRWASSAPSRACSTSSASSATSARNAKAPTLRDVGRRRLRRRRRAPRPVADRLGDQRGPAVRGRGRHATSQPMRARGLRRRVRRGSETARAERISERRCRFDRSEAVRQTGSTMTSNAAPDVSSRDLHARRGAFRFSPSRGRILLTRPWTPQTPTSTQERCAAHWRRDDRSASGTTMTDSDQQ